MPASVTINYLAVLVAALANMALGFVWYGPLFGKQWMKLMGFDKKKLNVMKTNMTKTYALGFISTLVMSYVLSHFVDYIGATSVGEGAAAGFWIWLGFIATITLGSVLWERKPFSLYTLNNAYNLIGLIVMGIILAVWV